MNNLKELFTEEDFKMLNEAVDSISKADFGMFMMSEMLFSGFSKDKDPEAREKERDERMAKQQAEQNQKEEKALKLKFKLLQLKEFIFQSEMPPFPPLSSTFKERLQEKTIEELNPAYYNRTNPLK
ncbi:hypothetical protein ATE49_04915 [Elizabethkingia miricola]|uniref:Uncharacterized protein n=1 Tax=Elizabethkingia miricola TaxID=172045 RepID=A0ABY3NGK3_ELIMR|nr:hypothetical protein [Elizabethkingia miricola]OBS12565.1 hypothetical protein ATE49_04915 [Elizabethkingia miricola]TYO91955.1 hypothetical protein LX74_02206 [Elizabethkingia miricola]